MANPRDRVGFTTARNRRHTYRYDDTIVYDKTKPGNSLQVGRAVTETGEASDVISLVGDGERVLGRLEIVEADGNCTVTDWGVVELPAGASAAVTHGFPIVGALGPASAEGYVKADNTAVLGRGSIKKNADTTKLQVDLD